MAHAGDEPRLRAAVAGKRVLVTGASYGVGEATARRLAGAGATVLLTARSADRLDALVAEIGAAGGEAHAHAADMTEMKSVDALAAWALEEHGPIDVVVSNAGKSIRRSVSLSYDRFHDFERTIGVNYLGPVRLLLALLPSMRARGEGQVISVSTWIVRVPPMPRWGAYLASKTAFDAWLRSAASELRSDGVAVTSIYPGLIRTRMSAPTPIYRLVPANTPDQMARMICRAIVRQPRSIAPLGISTVGGLFMPSRNFWDKVFGLSYRYTEDTAAARGVDPTDSAGPAALSEWVLTARLGRRALRALRGAGVLKPLPASRLPALGRVLQAGKGAAALVALAAARNPDRVAVADDRGEVSYAELDRRSAAIAAGLRDRFGVGAGTPVALLCRNHRGFVEAFLAATRLGADLMLLNTDSPAPQLAKIFGRERPAAIVHDQEFESRILDSGFDGARVVAWHDGQVEGASLDALAAGPAVRFRGPARAGRVAMLTSGTTGVPKSAAREPELAALLIPANAMLSSLPLRSGDALMVAPPLFHGLGLSTMFLGFVLGSTLVLSHRFEPDRALEEIDRYQVRGLVAVPVMLDRILRHLSATHDSPRGSSLRAIVSGGSALSPALWAAVTGAFGDVLYNLYGSSEAGFVSIASPADLRAAPGTIGRPAFGVTVKVLDAKRREAAAGEVGHVFVGSALVSDGYASGEKAKETVDGMINTGDLGRRDEAGRILVDGREDTMIVSGGENVFPEEVVDVLGGHEAIADVAVVGIEDEEFGQRLRAYLVAEPGTKPTEEELRLYVKAQLPRYQVPREFVLVDEIPRTATGKVRLRAFDASA